MSPLRRSTGGRASRTRCSTRCARGRAALDLAFLTLEVRASNAPAIALYRKHGFQTVGQRRNYYQKPDEDALLMTWFRREAETI